MAVADLICSACSEGYPPDRLGKCECGGILRASYRSVEIPQAGQGQRGIERFRSMLPAQTPILSLGEGNTPLVASRHFGPLIGSDVHFKLEGLNPSGSFKDRAAALAVTLALEQGRRGIMTASSGNAAAAIASYSAAAGLACLILVEAESPASKLRQIAVTGARTVIVSDLFTHGPESSARVLMEIAERLDYYLGFIWAPVNPFLLEALKTISYEIVESLGRAPEVVVAPVGGGDLLTAQWRGYCELRQAGRIQRLPRMVAVQSALAAPLYEAFRRGLPGVPTLSEARSRASGINVPFSGDHALQAVRESEGIVVAVQDEEILSAQAELAQREGIWVEPASAAPVAALRQLKDLGILKEGTLAVVVLTGAGFKDPHLGLKEASNWSKRPPLPLDAETILREALSDVLHA